MTKFKVVTRAEVTARETKRAAEQTAERAAYEAKLAAEDAARDARARSRAEAAKAVLAWWRGQIASAAPDAVELEEATIAYRAADAAYWASKPEQPALASGSATTQATYSWRGSQGTYEYVHAGTYEYMSPDERGTRQDNVYTRTLVSGEDVWAAWQRCLDEWRGGTPSQGRRDTAEIAVRAAVSGRDRPGSRFSRWRLFDPGRDGTFAVPPAIYRSLSCEVHPEFSRADFPR